MPVYHENEKMEIFKVLYPLFKKEVYDRRDQILKTASLATAFLFLLIIVLSLVKLKGVSFAGVTFPLFLGALLFDLVIGYHLYQHKSRHEKAKLMLIDLEDQMGFFREGVFEKQKPFYPQVWKIRSLDPGFIFYPLIHSGMIGLLAYLLM